MPPPGAMAGPDLEQPRQLQERREVVFKIYHPQARTTLKTLLRVASFGPHSTPKKQVYCSHFMDGNVEDALT